MTSFWNHAPEIEKDLLGVHEVLKQELSRGIAPVREALSGLLDTGGKMLRPGLFLTCARFGEFVPERHYKLAAAVEMLHLATLVHDDIIDKSPIRRGFPSVFAKLGVRGAVLTGDYLFTRCFQLVTESADCENAREVARTLTYLSESELLQTSLLYKKNETIREYLRQIRGKTAALFSAACFAGGRESGCDEKTSKTMSRIGYYLGMAFQIRDDILDYTGSEKVLQKPVGNDLREGIYTLPLLFAIRNDNSPLKKIIVSKKLSSGKIKKAVDLIRNSDGIEKAQAVSDSYSKKALQNIAKLPDNHMKKVLSQCIEKLSDRKI